MDTLELSPEFIFEMRSYLRDRITQIPTNLFNMDIVEHAEKNRVIPAGTPRPGPVDFDYTPYLIEPINNMSPSSIIQITSVMKGAQLGFTMGVECVVNYYIGEVPSDQLFISASSSSIEKWAQRRLEPAITSYGYRSIIQAIDSPSGKRQGDKMFSKEYFGRRLDMASAQSASSMRATDKRVLIRDEVDGSPAKLRTGEGNWMSVSFARTNSWADRRKVFDLSTPTNFETSQIWKEFKKGDQRYYNVPCPHCKELQHLEMKNLIAEKDEDDMITNAFYACKHCGEAIYNYHKRLILNPRLAEWIPTQKPISKFRRSYHINSLYSPIGMLSWTEIAQMRDTAEKSIDPEDMKSFTNLYEGKPFKLQGQKPKLAAIIENKGIYKAGTVPNMTLFITIGIDVQRGSEKDKLNPARLELEILGTGPGYRTFSIDYKKFEGPVDNCNAGAWEDLHEWALETGLVFKKENGEEINAALTFIDSGDGKNTETVYRFTQRWNGAFPIKGFRTVDKRDGLDKSSASDFKRYKRSKINSETILYNISTNYYKNTIYNNLKIKRINEDIQSPGFSEFPIDYNDTYFKMLTAEERRSDGNFYLKEHTRNEALDCRVYALCAADVYLDALIDQYRNALKNRNAPEHQIKEITRRWVIEKLKTDMNVQD